jgi:hypothetical protein
MDKDGAVAVERLAGCGELAAVPGAEQLSQASAGC